MFHCTQDEQGYHRGGKPPSSVVPTYRFRTCYPAAPPGASPFRARSHVKDRYPPFGFLTNMNTLCHLLRQFNHDNDWIVRDKRVILNPFLFLTSILSKQFSSLNNTKNTRNRTHHVGSPFAGKNRPAQFYLSISC